MPIRDREPSVYPADLFANGKAPNDAHGPTPSSEPSSLLAADSQGRRWWAVFTKSRQEKALARDLEAQTVAYFLPLVPREHRIRGRRVLSYIPLFTGYLFMLGTEDERYLALTTNRVSRLLPVPDQYQLSSDLLQLHQLIECNAPLTVERRITAGQKVRIKSGPMMGLEGTVTSRRGRRRLLVAVQFLQNGVSVEIDDYMVELA